MGSADPPLGVHGLHGDRHRQHRRSGTGGDASALDDLLAALPWFSFLARGQLRHGKGNAVISLLLTLGLVGAGEPGGEPEPIRAHAPSDPIAGREHWAYQQLREARPPSLYYGDWPRTAIDAFVLARLEGADMRPAPDAGRRSR